VPPHRAQYRTGGFPSRVETVLMHNPVSTGKPFGPDGKPRYRLQYQCLIASKQARGCAFILPQLATVSRVFYAFEDQSAASLPQYVPARPRAPFDAQVTARPSPTQIAGIEAPSAFTGDTFVHLENLDGPTLLQLLLQPCPSARPRVASARRLAP
jgi:hypothetical protein